VRAIRPRERSAVDSGCDFDPAQRLQAAETTTGLAEGEPPGFHQGQPGGLRNAVQATTDVIFGITGALKDEGLLIPSSDVFDPMEVGNAISSL
jgi:hypothetical protein